MLPKSSDKVTSPPKTATNRVEDGKIKKLKSVAKPELTAIQHINGKTYACESCKRGHRVHKCDHGKTRPISETNQPGRPSGGQKRGCQCPRNCACTSKTCKCKRDCSCTQDMYVIVRVDGPQLINRDASSTPKPVWEDADGNKMTLKKVWADANGKQIDEEEYNKRRKRTKEREEGLPATPQPKSCCSTTQLKEEADSPPTTTEMGGCRHRQNLSVVPRADTNLQEPAQFPGKMPHEPWMAACSCGSGCSCLYCPDHPNNATSINHTQQQVKNFAEQAYAAHGSVPNINSSIPDSHSRSCMGGRPAFFLSRTPGVSQQQLQQFFADSLNPNAIYLTYPIQQHSWTNQPVSAHCSQIPSPSAPIAMTPDEPPADSYIDHSSEFLNNSIPWELLPDDSNGTWNFSDSHLGDNGFSWVDFDASRGTDYNVGQATVASMSDAFTLNVPQSSSLQQSLSPIVNFDAILHSSSDLATTVPQFVSQNGYAPLPNPHVHHAPGPPIDLSDATVNMIHLQHPRFDLSDLNASTFRPYSVAQSPPMVGSCCGGPGELIPANPPAWNPTDEFSNFEVARGLRTSIPNSPPITNGA